MCHHVDIRSIADFLKADALWFRSRCSFVKGYSLPLKKKELPVEAPPKVLQNSVFDGQRSVIFETVVFWDTSALICKAGANGELQISTF